MGCQRKGSERGSEKNVLEAKLAMRLSLAGMVLSAEGGGGTPCNLNRILARRRSCPS